ncbi:hypothetical protein [Variovorax sp. R-27]|uniref:hypothetical protein n=1 Tax=Variovorax sp. R-27 TaxID=3404058 RepID=UPI003CE72D67
MEFSSQKKTIPTFKKVESILDRGASPEETAVVYAVEVSSAEAPPAERLSGVFLHSYLLVFARAIGIIEPGLRASSALSRKLEHVGDLFSPSKDPPPPREVERQKREQPSTVRCIE